MPRPSPTAAQSGFTFVEMLITLIILGVLAALLIQNLAGAHGSAQRQVARTYLQGCLAAAEQRRDFMTNRLPSGLTSCLALGLPRPQGVLSATFAPVSGNRLTLNVTVLVQGQAETLTGDLALTPAP